MTNKFLLYLKKLLRIKEEYVFYTPHSNEILILDLPTKTVHYGKIIYFSFCHLSYEQLFNYYKKQHTLLGRL